ncbi:Transcription factor HES-3 [Collichthys lucidus]|uniref:Transcription factor HES-3 n=1 Tax=Collichthys lucidus TaxID=240159 RepID=A0A4U5US67_COLLU|nr:Transcription factor HES-3 [Collichthys lucidus]
MVATTDCAEKSKTITGNKVSKPLMEKKRRARINKCLDQLKSLLESYYSTSIRKRKLEKADILELTVKHLKNLQKIQSCTAAASEFSDYQTGFRTCLANVNQYLLMADNLNGSDRWTLSQLSSKLCRSRGREEAFSTMDSGLCQPETQDDAQRLLPSAAGPEERKTTKSKALKPNNLSTSPALQSEEVRHPTGNKKAVFAATVPTQKTPERSSSLKKFHSVSHRSEAANTQRIVWRPW